MPNPVSVADLEERFRPLSAQEAINAQGLLDDAWDLLLVRVPALESRLSDGSLSVGSIRYVMRESLLPLLRNPEGYKRWSIDDATFERDGGSDGRLLIADDLVALLMPGAGTRRTGAFSVAPGRESSRAPGSESEFIDYLRYGSRW